MHRMFAALAASWGLVFDIAAQYAPPLEAAQAARPNIVLIFPDNLGWGEVGAYGGVRGRVSRTNL